MQHATALAAAALAAITFLPAQAPHVPAATPGQLEEMLPASTYATIRFGGLAACREAADALPLAAVVQAFLQRVPAGVRQQFVEQHLEEAAGEVRDALQEIGLSAADVRAIAARPMALAVGRMSVEGMGPSIALLVDEGNSGEAIHRCYDAAAQALAHLDRRTKIGQATIGDIRVSHVQNGDAPPLFAGSVGGVFVVTNSRGYLKELAAVAAGKQPGLGRATRLASLQQQLPAAALASLFVNTASICTAIAPHLPYEAEDFAAALGMGQVDALYAATTAAAGGGADVLHLGVGGSEKGMMKALVSAPADQSLAAACSNNTVIYGAASFDVPAVVAAFERFTAFLPAALGDELRRELGRHLDGKLPLGDGGTTTPRAVMGAFGSQVAFALGLEKGAIPKPELLIRIAVRDPAVVAPLLQSLEAATSRHAQVEWKTRKAGANEIRYCNVQVPNAQLQLSPSWLLRDGALWLASDTQALVRSLRQADDAATSLASQPDFQQMLAATKGASGVLHVRSFRAVELGWRGVETLAYPLLDAHKDDIGFGSDALPDAETMAKALGTSTISYRVDDDGVTCRSDGAFTFGALLAALGAGADNVLGRAGSKVY